MSLITTIRKPGLSWLFCLAFAAMPQAVEATPLPPAEVPLITATFNGTDDGLAETFTLLTNGAGSPAWDNETGEATMSANESSSGTVGCVSEATFDGSSFTAITATFTIDRIADPDGQPTNNGHWAGLQGTDLELWNNAQRQGAVDGWAVGIRYLAGSLNLVYDNTSGNEITIASLGTYTLTSLQNGYTVAFRFASDGWQVCLTGIDGAVDAQGAWPAAFDYATLAADSTIHAAATYQQANEAGTILDMGSIVVAGDPVAPELLIAASFNQVDDGLQEEFTLLSNGIGAPAWDNALGRATMTSDEPDASGVVGAVSQGSFDGSSFQRFEVTASMETIVDEDGGPSGRGHWLGIQGGRTEFWYQADRDGPFNGWSLGLRFLEGEVDLVYHNSSGDEQVLGSLGSYGLSSFQDDYSATLELDEGGWSARLDGVGNGLAANGGWVEVFDFSVISGDNNIFAAMTYEQEAEAGTAVTMDAFQVAGYYPIEPVIVDGDHDGMLDEWELANGLDPADATDRDADLDGDGLSNFEEFNLNTLAGERDSDRDGLDDFAEVRHYRTDPRDADSDDDFLNDLDELVTFRTDPLLPDSDEDGFPDGAELAALSNPLDGEITPSGQDGDEDGLLDALEMTAFGHLGEGGLDDSDGDQFPNIVEQAFGSLMNEQGSIPQIEIDSSLELSFRRQRKAGVGYELLVSADLESWQPFLGFLTENTASPVDGDYEKARYQVASDDSSMFVKVNSRTEIRGRPNIVLFYTDDQGYGDMGANNPETKFPTPHHDRLAAQGINFTDAHSSDTVCTPSRYGLLTGRYCWRTSLKTNVLGSDDPALIPDERMTLASLLKSQGYATAMVGKWHLGMDIPGTNGNRDFSQPIDDMPLDVGFDHFYGIPASMNFGYLAWIEGRFTPVNPTQFTSKKPNGLPGVFSDYRITPPYNQSSGLEAAPDFDDVLCLTRFTDEALEWMEGRVDDAQAGRPFFIYIPYTSPHKPVIPREDFLGLSEAGAYGDFMMETDYHMGRVLDYLDENGLANNTMVIVSSDNGPETTYKARVTTYEHDSAGIYRGGKRDIYEGGHRVPFVVRWPAGIDRPGRSWDQPICQTDLLATCAEMLGVDLDEQSGEDSVSFYEVLRDESAAPERLPLIHHSFSGRFAIRDGEWKLIMPHEGSGYELYHLASDPTESQNVYGANARLAALLEDKITEIVTSGRTTPGEAVGNDTGWWDDLEWIEAVDY
ncbi:MAG: arylsulfatase [Verrucomicrobiota bacterium JB023]|nr:arylsulfatase [Verrucomicrobiota bacterium JB023]